ncbi:unnamed protein product, partial [Prorocentrum cordatum]
ASGVEPNGETYSALVRALCNAGDLAGAREYLARATKLGLSLDFETHLKLVVDLVRAGEVAGAKEVRQDMGVRFEHLGREGWEQQLRAAAALGTAGGAAAVE